MKHSLLVAAFLVIGSSLHAAVTDDLARSFANPPDSAKPWVYWFWMDGNLSREGITTDLEAMQRAGIGGMIIMEVDVGIPRGPVRFMSEPWRALFKHAVLEAQRLNLQITLNAGPGWTGSGGPWVKPEQSMQHLVAAATNISGGQLFKGVLPKPATKAGFYEDVAVLAFPTPSEDYLIPDIVEKALYDRQPYSSQPGVKPFLPAPGEFPSIAPGAIIPRDRISDLSERLDAKGQLTWDAPQGRWTILRLGRTSTGANTRPAPEPGIGLESDKFDRAALEAHYEKFVGVLLQELGPVRPKNPTNGWTMLHIDSWEMGAQNWTGKFREEFRTRRGYDPLPFLPVLTGRVVDNLEVAERFLWDLRQTAQELVVENHARHLKTLGRQDGFGLSIEPYDMNPCSDLSLGGEADVPMCEFWAKGYGFDTAFSCLESVSIAHTLGRPIIAAEAFTADSPQAWRLHPGTMKAQADWAFCVGINRFVFHRYAHQPWLDRWPGMTMGPYGVNYERTQTWWDLVGAWHTWLKRCQFMLRQGVPVADICYLAPEGAPHVFRPPPSALDGEQPIPDRRGYNFDGCAPETVLKQMTVRDGRLVLPGGASYRLLVLPEMETMTPQLLRKVDQLVRAGATVIGPPPKKSPSLSGYPGCDGEVQRMAEDLWGKDMAGSHLVRRKAGKGAMIATVPATRSGQKETPPARLPAEARWIWHAEGNPAHAAPVASRWFRREIVLDPGTKIDNARLVITADNSFEARLNGVVLGEGDNFHIAYAYDLAKHLKPGTNVLLVSAENGGQSPNPAGLIAAVQFVGKSEKTTDLVSDASWHSATNASGPWQPAMVLGALGMGPWGRVGESSLTPPTPPPYPAYDVTAKILAEMNVLPDFESDASLRYTHRILGKTDIYYVANRENSWVDAKCQFRVTGKKATVWDPLGGRILKHDTRATKGRTSLTLRLEPHGSVFVVFSPGSAPGSAISEPLFAELDSVFEITGPWEVQFQPGRGAPAGVTLPELGDWSEQSDVGIRFFSGLAVYRKSFDVPAEILQKKNPLMLDLGGVQVMARVKLNGHDLGTVWKTPFRVKIGSALHVGQNRLEIEVANLWPNRLIGDKGLPPEQRIAWTTFNPFKKDTPLLESGLLGPVRLLGESSQKDK